MSSSEPKRPKKQPDFVGAVIRLKGMRIGLIQVEEDTLSSDDKATAALTAFKEVFFKGIELETVLVVKDPNGKISFFGPPLAVGAVQSVPLRTIPWREYHLRT